MVKKPSHASKPILVLSREFLEICTTANDKQGGFEFIAQTLQNINESQALILKGLYSDEVVSQEELDVKLAQILMGAIRLGCFFDLERMLVMLSREARTLRDYVYKKPEQMLDS